MKNVKTTLFKWSFMLICLCFFSKQIKAQNYTNTYNGINYSSTQHYNLNIIYFVPNDVPFDLTYKTRLSKIMLWGQNFYKQNMISNGYGAKTFGLFTETSNPNNVEFIVIHGASPHTSYAYNNRTTMDSEIATYFTNNPSHKTSEHTLVITAVSDQATADAPFFGLGKTCYAIDYPQFYIQYLGTNTHSFTGWFGGMMHELGHGLNLPHSAQTNTEYNDPNKGVTLMSFGNTTLGSSPTFINRGGCAILNTCQVFASAPGITYYNGNTSKTTSLHSTFNNGILSVSGTFQSNRTVKDVNIYQNPTPYSFPGNNSVTWSVSPTGNNFSVNMPTSELTFLNQDYYLVIQLVLENGESSFEYYKYSYVNGVPTLSFDFDTVSTCVGSSLQFSTAISGNSYQWQFQNANETWSNYPEGNVSGYATFSGTQTNTLTISNISSQYVNNPNKARVAITGTDGKVTYSQAWVWSAKENATITTQPAASTTACVGSSIQLSAQATGASTYQWQFQNSNGTWSNYPEGNISGYATFSGTQTNTMTVSNISSLYVNSPNQARVLITNSNGCSTTSSTATWNAKETVTITTQPAASTTACVGSAIQLSAQATGASTYQWQFQNANGTWSNYPEGNVSGYATFSGTKTKTMSISNISSAYINNPNYARVLITNSNGCSTASSTATWKAQNCTAKQANNKIQEKLPTDEQKVYPNPVKDELNINLGSVKDTYYVEITNSLGQVVYKITTSERSMKVQLSDKPAGLYFVTIKSTTKGTAKSFKIIKQ